MQVKLKTPRATDRGVQERDAIIEVSHEEAQRMFAKGHAEPVKVQPPERK